MMKTFRPVHGCRYFPSARTLINDLSKHLLQYFARPIQFVAHDDAVVAELGAGLNLINIYRNRLIAGIASGSIWRGFCLENSQSLQFPITYITQSGQCKAMCF